MIGNGQLQNATQSLQVKIVNAHISKCYEWCESINQISQKNIQQIPQWIKENPKYKDSESNKNTEYLQIVNESMGCTYKDNYNKIIHNISKEVLVDK